MRVSWPLPHTFNKSSSIIQAFRDSKSNLGLQQYFNIETHPHRSALSSVKSGMGRLREDLRKSWEKERGRMSDSLLFLELVMLPKEVCGLAGELIEFHNLPHIPADTKCLARREASQEANAMARPRLGTAVSLSISNSWLKIACLLAPQPRAPTDK